MHLLEKYRLQHKEQIRVGATGDRRPGGAQAEGGPGVRLLERYRGSLSKAAGGGDGTIKAEPPPAL